MIDFLATFVYPLPQHRNVHSVVVKMFRHSLMHTGALRFAYDEVEEVGYTWRVQFGVLPGNLDHYSIEVVDPKYQDQLLTALSPSCTLKEIRAINISIPVLVDNLYGGISRYLQQRRVDSGLQAKYMATEAVMVMQIFKRQLPTL
jgi:hypothetical protein